MTPTFLKIGALSIGLLFPMCLTEHSFAELSDPFATVSANSTLAQYSPKKQVAGAFKIQSSEALYPLLHRLNTDFQRFQPKVSIEIKKGTSKAITDFLQPPISKLGKIMMIDDRAASFQLLATPRQLSDAELKEFVAQHGYEPTAVPVAVNAVALYVHKDNPLPGLTLGQVDAMFSSTRKRGANAAISQWGQLGLPDGWKEAPIQLYGRDKRSEARATFQERGLAGGEFISNVQEYPGAASVVMHINHDPKAIGYSGVGLHTSNVRMVPIAEKEGMPFVLPSRESMADQTYPLRHVVYLYFDKSPHSVLPDAVREFLAFVTMRDGEETLIKAGWFPLPPTAAQSRTVALLDPIGQSGVLQR